MPERNSNLTAIVATIAGSGILGGASGGYFGDSAVDARFGRMEHRIAISRKDFEAKDTEIVLLMISRFDKAYAEMQERDSAIRTELLEKDAAVRVRIRACEKHIPSSDLPDDLEGMLLGLMEGETSVNQTD